MPQLFSLDHVFVVQFKKKEKLYFFFCKGFPEPWADPGQHCSQALDRYALFPGADGGSVKVTVPAETRIVLRGAGRVVRSFQGIAGSQQPTPTGRCAQSD